MRPYGLKAVWCQGLVGNETGKVDCCDTIKNFKCQAKESEIYSLSPEDSEKPFRSKELYEENDILEKNHLDITLFQA